MKNVNLKTECRKWKVEKDILELQKLGVKNTN